jgi:hypothetical protein
VGGVGKQMESLDILESSPVPERDGTSVEARIYSSPLT